MLRPYKRPIRLWSFSLFVGDETIMVEYVRNEREEKMPHIIVKLYPGRTEEQKKRLTEEIVKDVVTIAKCEEKSVSVTASHSSFNQDYAEQVNDNANKIGLTP